MGASRDPRETENQRTRGPEDQDQAIRVRRGADGTATTEQQQERIGTLAASDPMPHAKARVQGSHTPQGPSTAGSRPILRSSRKSKHKKKRHPTKRSEEPLQEKRRPAKRRREEQGPLQERNLPKKKSSGYISAEASGGARPQYFEDSYIAQRPSGLDTHEGTRLRMISPFTR